LIGGGRHGRRRQPAYEKILLILLDIIAFTVAL
jgi:hypothetical protein